MSGKLHPKLHPHNGVVLVVNGAQLPSNGLSAAVGKAGPSLNGVGHPGGVATSLATAGLGAASNPLAQARAGARPKQQAEDRRIFFENLARFHICNGTSVDIAHAPLLYGACVDLYSLWLLVNAHGGLAKAATTRAAFATIYGLLPNAPSRTVQPGAAPELLVMQLYTKVRLPP